MKKLRILPLATLLCLAACTKEPRPEYMPDNDKMAWLFTEIHLTESTYRMGFVKNKESVKPFYETSLNKYGLSPEQFDTCLMWLSRNRRDYEKIYETVMQRLRKEKDKQSDEEGQRAIARSVWKRFGKKKLDTSIKDDSSNTSVVGDYWVALDSINKVLPPDFCQRHGGSSPYIK